jgi:hypothetical protein
MSKIANDPPYTYFTIHRMLQAPSNTEEILRREKWG